MVKNIAFIIAFLTLLYSCEFKFDAGTHTMEPGIKYDSQYTIDHGDRQHGRSYEKVKRYDIIEFELYDNNYDSSLRWSMDEIHISRLIAFPHEKVEIKNGFVYINDKLIDEPYVHDSVRSNDTYPPIVLPAGEYYIMVDNRKMPYDSTMDAAHKPYDSRFIGTINYSTIHGVANFK